MNAVVDSYPSIVSERGMLECVTRDLREEVVQSASTHVMRDALRAKSRFSPAGERSEGEEDLLQEVQQARRTQGHPVQDWQGQPVRSG